MSEFRSPGDKGTQARNTLERTDSREANPGFARVTGLPPGYTWATLEPTVEPPREPDDATLSVLFRCAPPPPPLLAAPPAPPGTRRLCLVVGPQQSGKTTLIAACARAPMRDPAGGVARLVRLGEGFQSFVDEATRRFRADLGRGATPTWFRDGELDLECPEEPMPRCSSWVMREAHAHLTFGSSEYPAPRLGVFSPPLRESSAYAWASTALVLCVNADEKHRDLWAQHLPASLTHWRLAAQTMRGRGTLPPWPGERLPFDRILVLATCFDEFCDRARAGIEQAGPPVESLRALSWLDLARKLDPLRQVADLLGPRLLEMLAGHAHAGARLAVGLVSARGLAPSPPEPEITGSGWRHGDWEPFGVREALAFLDGETARFPLASVELGELGHGVAGL